MSDMVKMFHTGEPAVSVGNKLDVGWQSDMHQMTETGGKWQPRTYFCNNYKVIV